MRGRLRLSQNLLVDHLRVSTSKHSDLSSREQRSNRAQSSAARQSCLLEALSPSGNMRYEKQGGTYLPHWSPTKVGHKGASVLYCTWSVAVCTAVPVPCRHPAASELHGGRRHCNPMQPQIISGVKGLGIFRHLIFNVFFYFPILCINPFPMCWAGGPGWLPWYCYYCRGV